MPQSLIEINALKRKLPLTHPDKEQFDLYRELFGKYRSYRLDSALWAAKQTVQLAHLHIAEVMMGVGMYKESIAILESINARNLDIAELFHYYYQYHRLYTLLSDYAFSNELKEQYRRLKAVGEKTVITMTRKNLTTEALRRAFSRRSLILSTSMSDT